MTMEAILITAALVAGNGFIPPSPADSGHGLRMQFPAAGFDLIEAQLPTLIPEAIHLAEISGTLMQCAGSTAITWHQQGTVIELDLRSVDISVPAPNTLRLGLLLDADAQGVAFIDNAYLCFGSLSCNDSLTVDSLGVVADLAVTLDAEGVPQVTILDIDIQFDSDALVFELRDCLLDDIATWIIDAGKDLLFDVILQYVEGMITEQIAPRLQQMLANLTSYSGTVDFALFSVWGKSLNITPDGIDIIAEADLWSPYPLAGCLTTDAPPPEVAHTDFPALDNLGSHLAIGIELGLIEDALYHIWHRGLLCLTDRHLIELGMPLDLAPLLTILPGYPPGTHFTIELNVVSPPRVRGSTDNSATVSLDVDEAVVQIIGELPDATVRTLAVTVGADITAQIGLQPASGALTLRLVSAQLTTFAIDDPGMGIDDNRLRRAIEVELLPSLLLNLRETVLLQPTAGVQNFAATARTVTTTQSHIAVALELFRASSDDTTPPQTTAHLAHERPILPSEDAVLFMATDDTTPRELCRFEVAIDGGSPLTTFRSSLRLGESGNTTQHRVSVAAVDMSGNIDPTPVELSLTIDGIPPSLQLTSRRNTVTDDATATLHWHAVDDLTPPEMLRPHLTLWRFADSITMSTAVEILDTDLPPKERATQLRFATTGSYQASLSVYDEAGNKSSITASYLVEDGGSCRQTPTANSTLLIFGLAWFLMRRPRRRS